MRVPHITTAGILCGAALAAFYRICVTSRPDPTHDLSVVRHICQSTVLPKRTRHCIEKLRRRSVEHSKNGSGGFSGKYISKLDNDVDSYLKTLMGFVEATMSSSMSFSELPPFSFSGARNGPQVLYMRT